MSFLDQIIVKVSLKAFQEAELEKRRVHGRLGNCDTMCLRVLLGEEIQDTTYHPDSTTEYRKFIDCKVDFAESFEHFKSGQLIKGASLDERTVWIFAK